MSEIVGLPWRVQAIHLRLAWEDNSEIVAVIAHCLQAFLMAGGLVKAVLEIIAELCQLSQAILMRSGLVKTVLEIIGFFGSASLHMKVGLGRQSMSCRRACPLHASRSQGRWACEGRH